MAGATIDHMISLTILIAALLVAMTTYNNMFATAVDYDRNRQVATKAADLMNTICLSPGNPTDWGETDASLLGFGLQDPEAGGYALSPYSIMRLNTAYNDSQLVHYPRTDLFYNNISTNYGHAILTPIGNCVNYTTAAELLGVNGTYGFGVDVTPTLDVIVSSVSDSQLKLNVEVYGSGMPLSEAALNYYLFHVESGTPCPSITRYPTNPPGVAHTNSSGSVDIEFPIDADSAYSFVVYVSLGGVNGVGYYTCNTVDDSTFIVPLIEGYEDVKLNLILAHSWEFLRPGEEATANYTASFYTLTSDFQLQPCVIPNSAGLVNSTAESPITTQIPNSETALLVISYMANSELGSVIVPWGVGALGVSASFGGGIGSAGYDFVATELRQVNINDISYHVKVSAWKLGS